VTRLDPLKELFVKCRNLRQFSLSNGMSLPHLTSLHPFDITLAVILELDVDSEPSTSSVTGLIHLAKAFLTWSGGHLH
jgi:hypothetical protein